MPVPSVWIAEGTIIDKPPVYITRWLSFTRIPILKSMGKCKEDVTPERKQWTNVFFALFHRHMEVQQGPLYLTSINFIPNMDK